MAKLHVVEEKIITNIHAEEPIRVIHDRIEKSGSPVLVLKGERGSGRSTILLTKETQNQLRKGISVFHRFEYAGFGVTSKEVGLDFIKHKFELEMTRMFLKFINSNGIYTAQTELIEMELKKARRLFTYDINHLENDNFKSEIVGVGHYTEDLVKQIKQSYSPEKFSLLVDRFDWMFNSSMEAQTCIKDYFPFFDQVVLTTDDENYLSKYPTIEADYGKNRDTVLEIVRKYVWTMNTRRGIEERLDLSFFSEEVIDYMIEKSNGNIDILLQTIDNLYLGEYPEKELNGALEKELTGLVNERQKVKQIETPQPRFYI